MTDNEDVKRIEELIDIVKRRKHVLDKTAAMEGTHTPPSIVLHQQEAETEIQRLENQKQQLLAAIVMPSVTRRRDAWAQSVADGIVALSDKGLSAEDLAQNEAFTTAFLHASQVAMRSHQKEKLRALRNAVLNSAMKNAPEEDLQLIFLGFVDTLTPLHIRVLKFVDEPEIKIRTNNIEIPDWRTTGKELEFYQFIYYVFPELRSDNGIYRHILSELSNKGLTDAGNLNNSELGSFYAQYNVASFFLVITSLGKQFLSFIASPIEGDDL